MGDGGWIEKEERINHDQVTLISFIRGSMDNLEGEVFIQFECAIPISLFLQVLLIIRRRGLAEQLRRKEAAGTLSYCANRGGKQRSNFGTL